MMAPYASGSFIIDECSNDAAGERTDHDEPPPGHHERNDHCHNARHHPTDRATRAAPERNEHRGKEDNEYEIEPEPLWVRNERAEQITRDRRSHPNDPERKTG